MVQEDWNDDDRAPLRTMRHEEREPDRDTVKMCKAIRAAEIPDADRSVYRDLAFNDSRFGSDGAEEYSRSERGPKEHANARANAMANAMANANTKANAKATTKEDEKLPQPEGSKGFAYI